MASAISALLNQKKTIYVGGLDSAVTEDIVRNTFITFGEILQVVMPLDTTTGLHRGFAFIEFELSEDAEHALYNLNNAELFGKTIRLSYANPQALAKNKAVWELADDVAGNSEDQPTEGPFNSTDMEVS